MLLWNSNQGNRYFCESWHPFAILLLLLLLFNSFLTLGENIEQNPKNMLLSTSSSTDASDR